VFKHVFIPPFISITDIVYTEWFYLEKSEVVSLIIHLEHMNFTTFANTILGDDKDKDNQHCF